MRFAAHRNRLPQQNLPSPDSCSAQIHKASARDWGAPVCTTLKRNKSYGAATCFGFAAGCVECREEIALDDDWTATQAVNDNTLDNEVNRLLAAKGILSRGTLQRGRAGGSLGNEVDACAFGDGNVFVSPRCGSESERSRSAQFVFTCRVAEVSRSTSRGAQVAPDKRAAESCLQRARDAKGTGIRSPARPSHAGHRLLI